MNKHRVCVAPMMQYTDLHDRFFLRLISKNIFLYTEMISTGSIIFGNCLYQFDFNKEEHPVAVQLGGSNPNHLSECSKIAEDYGYDEVNLNVGCPSERVQKGKFGACLMLEPNLVAECVSKMSQAVSIPITVKCRLGIDNNNEYEFLENFINIVKVTGIKTFVIHARNGILKGLSPRQNRNIPPLKYDYVYRLKRDNPDLNIIINGGIKNLDESINHLKYVDGVMIGRASYDNPFMLSNVDEVIYKTQTVKKDKLEILNEYIDYILVMEKKGYDLSRMLKHLFGLSKGDKNAKLFRKRVHEIMLAGNLKDNRNKLIELIN
tara:strand:- start:3892 stop:4851 length:960 start_codon:yes stop_codon:yes gene_type:complete